MVAPRRGRSAEVVAPVPKLEDVGSNPAGPAAHDPMELNELHRTRPKATGR